MTRDRLRSVVAYYRGEFERLIVPKRVHAPDVPPADVMAILAHCNWMLDEIEQFAGEGRIGREKAARWLGFVQGCLWSCRWYTINHLREHNDS